MRTVTVTVNGVSPFSPSRFYEVPKLDKESHDAYDQRTWRERAHVDPDGNVIIPGIMFKKALEWIAAYLGEKIPGKGAKTWTKFFTSGTMPIGDIVLDIKKDDLECEALYVNADGRKGGNKRVVRRFPVIRKWGGTVEFAILDDTITEDVFERYFQEAGKFDGVGMWRPSRGGMKGRFEATSFNWSK